MKPSQKKISRYFVFCFILMVWQQAFAQAPLELDETCTVSLGNQTAIVRPDGTFFVRNISVFRSRATGIAPQLYRVRATCFSDDQMLTGQSEFFSLTPGQTTFIANVFPSELDPIPVRINASAPADFVPLGSTVQLSVAATLPDGNTTDVTARSAGTTYLSTNTRVLTVSDNGLVTGANTTSNPQTGTIAVLSEGNLATINFNTVGASNDFDNDGMPNDYEDLFGLNKFSNDANGDLDNDGLTNIEEFNLGTLPNNPDTDGDTIADGIDGNPLRPEESAPEVMLAVPEDGTTLFEGETVKFSADAMDDGLLTGVEFFVNGAFIGSAPIPPFEVPFTVPFAITDTLEITAEASDSVGNTSAANAFVSVIPDLLTTVQGLVVNSDTNPVAGSEVVLELSGLIAEFYDFNDSLNDFPDLTGLTPDETKPVSAINFRNPNNLFGVDTFGLGFTPDFAARLTGHIRASVPGIHSFTLGADDGARLTINGTQVVEVVGVGNITEATGDINLSVGTHPIEIEYFQADGSAELTLAVRAPEDSISSIVPPSDLLLSPSPFTTLTDLNGSFSVPNVPTILGDIQAMATAIIDGEEARGTSSQVMPTVDGITDLGEIVLSAGGLFGTSSVQGTNTSSLFEIDLETGESIFIGTPENTPNGLSDVAMDPITGKLYVIHGGSARGAELLELNPDTGAVITRVVITSSIFIRGSDALVFDDTGKLFVGAWAQGRLLVVDPSTGVAISDTPVSGGGGNNHLSDLAIDPTTGELWASRGGSFDGRIVRINSETSVVTQVIDLPGSPKVTAIAFDSTGTLYASLNGGQLAIVDKSTGAVTQVGTGFGGPKIAGLGFRR